MATLNVAGFDTGDTIEMAATSGTFSVQSSVTRGAWSGYALRTNPATSGTGFVRTGKIGTSGTNAAMALTTKAFARFYFRYDTNPASGDEVLFLFASGTTVSTRLLQVSLNSAGNLLLYSDSTDTLLGTGSTTLSSGVWYRIEVKADVSDRSNLVYELKIDGTSELTGSYASASAVLSWAYFGKSRNANSQSVDYYFDDVRIDNAAYPGDARVTLLLPNANGTYQTATIGAGSGSHYQVVDDVPHNGDTDYLVTDGITGHAETEALADTTSAGVSGTVNAAKPMVIVKRDGATNGGLKIRLRSASTDSDTFGSTSSTSAYTQVANVYDTDPATSVAWTTGGIDGAEVGAVEQLANKTRMTFCGLVVDYTPSGGGHNVAVGQISETDSTQTFAHTKLKAFGLNSETDSLLALTRIKTSGFSIVAETNLSQTFAHTKLKALGIEAETNLSQSITVPDQYFLGINTESDSTLAFGLLKTLSIGQNIEIDVSQTTTPLRVFTLGSNVEVDVSQTFLHTKLTTFGLVNEIDSILNFFSVKDKGINLCTEVDSGLGIQRVILIGINQTEEVDNSVSLFSVHTAAIHLVEETDEAFTFIIFLPRLVRVLETIYGSIDTTVIYGSVTTPTITGNSDVPIIYGS